MITDSSVAHVPRQDTRRSGLVCHEPQTGVPAGRPAAPRHGGNVASITRRRTEMTRPLGDLPKMALLGRAPLYPSHVLFAVESSRSRSLSAARACRNVLGTLHT